MDQKIVSPLIEKGIFNPTPTVQPFTLPVSLVGGFVTFPFTWNENGGARGLVVSAGITRTGPVPPDADLRAKVWASVPGIWMDISYHREIANGLWSDFVPFAGAEFQVIWVPTAAVTGPLAFALAPFIIANATEWWEAHFVSNGHDCPQNTYVENPPPDRPDRRLILQNQHL